MLLKQIMIVCEILATGFGQYKCRTFCPPVVGDNILINGVMLSVVGRIWGIAGENMDYEDMKQTHLNEEDFMHVQLICEIVKVIPITIHVPSSDSDRKN